MILGRVFNIKTDTIDARDYTYRPSLQILAPRFLCAVLASPSERANQTLRIRDQHQRPTCVGEALAALIDIQRYENLARARDGNIAVSFVPTSAAMLDRMARSIEQGEAGAVGGVLSLRSALRGFYNCGVATLADWPDESTMTFDQITDRIAESARHLGLGAYYRLENVLNDYHAALHEAGAVLVSASIHDGWAAPGDGVIAIGPGGAGTVHAFVLVGYTEEGFLVLNSFGESWGGYRFDGADPLPGVALWSYEDWAGSVRDAWVLRLAVPTPSAFRFTVGSYGKSRDGHPNAGASAAITRSEAPRRNAVIGRYLTFEEGRFQEDGPYPTTSRTVDTTLDILKRRNSNDPRSPYYGDVVLVFHGAPEAAEDAIGRTQARILQDKLDGIYRISVAWANTLFNGAAIALQPLFDAALQRRTKVGPECDDLIEKLTQPVGRAIWREVKSQARKLTMTQDDQASGLVRTVSELAALCARTGRRLHIVAEGAGAIAAGELVSCLAEDRHAKVALRTLQSVHLVAPTLSRRDLLDRFAPMLGQNRAGGPAVTVFKPDGDMDRRLAIGPYSKSWSSLIQSAFEDPGNSLISLAGAPAVRHPAVREIVLSARAVEKSGPLPLAELWNHADADAFLRSRIRAARTLKRGGAPQTLADITAEPEHEAGALDAIHVGVDRLDSSYYGRLPPLEGCGNDARALAALVDELGCRDQLLLTDRDATRAALVGAIHAKALSLRPGDTLLVTFSGHGNTAEDIDGDELLGLDATWCLHDGEIADDELFALWAVFPEGVDIVVLSDSCHSGSVIAAPRIQPDSAVANRGAARRLPAPAENRIVRDRSFQARARLGDMVGADLPRKRVAASVTLLSACLDDQLAYETADKPAGGAFTRAILAKLSRDPDLSATQLHTALLKTLKGQTPNVMRIGTHPLREPRRPLLGKLGRAAGPLAGSPGRRKPAMLPRPRSLVSDFLAFPFDPAFNLDLGRLSKLTDAMLHDLVGASADKLSLLGRTVARVMLNGNRIGTGFLVSPSLVATNAHVATAFASGRFWNNKPVSFELAAGSFNPFPVRGQTVELAWLPPLPRDGDPAQLDLALIRLPTPLPSIAAGDIDFGSDCLIGDPIAVVGYPGKAGNGIIEKEAKQRFNGDGIDNYFNHMWLSPGYVTHPPGMDGPGDFIDPNAWIARYNANTTPGNSGSMVVNLSTGKVIGIHYAGRKWETNFGYIFSRAKEINPEFKRLIEEDRIAHNGPGPSG